jgi:hypothetical protein
MLDLGDGEPLMTEALNCHGEGVVHVVEKPWDERVKDGGEVSRGRGPRSMEGSNLDLVLRRPNSRTIQALLLKPLYFKFVAWVAKTQREIFERTQTSKANGIGRVAHHH